MPKLSRVHEVMAVRDLHLENFGAWRDVEGRLVWGVNDFDEAHPMAFANDLVRLAVSALLAGASSWAGLHQAVWREVEQGSVAGRRWP